MAEEKNLREVLESLQEVLGSWGKDPESRREDEKARQERLATENRAAQVRLREARVRRLDAEVAQIEDVTKLRREYAGHALKFLRIWMAVVGALVIFQGFRLLGFELSDTVLTAIVGGTAVSVIGLVLAVIRGLFVVPPSSPSN